jgi:hypothetical protein
MSFVVDNKIYINKNWHYKVFRKNGRLIFVPSKKLKAEQKDFLQDLRGLFPMKPSTQKAAECHVGKKWILKMDIAGFYDSVPFEYIKEIVKTVCEKRIPLANTGYYTQLVTLDEKLPTGASTSAHIANACFRNAELKIKTFCSIYGVSYSRYMDDLTCSCDNKSVLNALEEIVREILSDNGYKINEKKLKYISDNRCQSVLGLVVNGDNVRIPNKQKRKIRALLYNYATGNRSKSKPDTTTLTSSYEHLTQKPIQENQLRGYLSYVKNVDEKYFTRLKEYVKKLEIRFVSEWKLPILF